MREKFLAFGLGRHGSTFVMHAIGASMPRGAVCEWHLHLLEPLGEQEASRAVGEAILLVLTYFHPASFRPYPDLAASPGMPQLSANPAPIVPLDPGPKGGMHHRLEMGVSDPGDALALRPVDARGQRQDDYTQEMRFWRLNRLGFYHAACFLGCASLQHLARDYPALFLPYPQISTLPGVR